MKKKLNEKIGGGARIGLGGVNSSGPYYDYHKTMHPTGYHSGGYTGNADSQISQRHALSSNLEEEKEEEQEENDNEESLTEFFARIIRMPLTEEEKKKIENIEEEDEEDVQEISAGGVAGVTTPLGTNAKGKVASAKELEDLKLAFNIYKK